MTLLVCCGIVMAKKVKDYNMPEPKNIKLYNQIKSRIKSDLKAKGLRWSARASQQLVNKYKAAGGKYTGSKKDSSLTNWQKQNWVAINSTGEIVGACGSSRTKSGKQYRCLPKSKAKKLTKSERAATAKKKLKTPNKIVKNTKKSKVK